MYLGNLKTCYFQARKWT